MWGLNWIKKRKSKKAFRIIAMNKGMQNIQPFSLCIPKHITSVRSQKKIIERIVEKHHKELRIVEPIHIQSIHLHVTQHMHTQTGKRKESRKWFHMDALRREMKRLQYQSFLEEQEYFRTRPTMARNLFQNMMKGKEPYILQGGEKVRPIHLEILKNAVAKEMLDTAQGKGIEPIPVTTNSIINYTLISQVVREVSRQLRKETWRTGGKG